jgi:hypothetical protein
MALAAADQREVLHRKQMRGSICYWGQQRLDVVARPYSVDPVAVSLPQNQTVPTRLSQKRIERIKVHPLPTLSLNNAGPNHLSESPRGPYETSRGKAAHGSTRESETLKPPPHVIISFKNIPLDSCFKRNGIEKCQGSMPCERELRRIGHCRRLVIFSPQNE